MRPFWTVVESDRDGMSRQEIISHWRLLSVDLFNQIDKALFKALSILLWSMRMNPIRIG